jgi:hypothetical protein
MAAADDVETQKLGAVAIIYQLNPNALICTDQNERASVFRMLSCIPLRFGALHLCLADHPMSHSLRTLSLLTVGSNVRTRARFHTGSDTECQYSLQSFGIDARSIPINTNSGKRKTKQHLKWIELRQMKEAAIRCGNVFDGIDCPHLKDILFGRGRPIMRHPGNVVFRNILESRLTDYNTATTKKEKSEIVLAVVRQIRSWSWRFLREDSRGWWVEVTDDVARQKVSIGFRDVRKTRDDVYVERNEAGNTIVRTNLIMNDDGSTGIDVGPGGQREHRKRTTAIRKNMVPIVEDSSTSVFMTLDGRGKKQRSCPEWNLCTG